MVFTVSECQDSYAYREHLLTDIMYLAFNNLFNNNFFNNFFNLFVSCAFKFLLSIYFSFFLNSFAQIAG